MSKLRWICAILCALALLPAGAAAQETGTVAGVVRNAVTSQPLSGVQIAVCDPDPPHTGLGSGWREHLSQRSESLHLGPGEAVPVRGVLPLQPGRSRVEWAALIR